MSGWIEENLHKDFHVKLKADRIIYESRTEHQHLVLFENQTFGRALALDNVLQTTEKDEFIYHEMLSHVPILAHGRVRSVLIIGGGDGGMLEEVLKHQDIERVTMVDIDDTVIELSKLHLRSICGEAFEDPRCQLVIADGAEFVRTSGEHFDVIIIDSTDPIGPGEVLFTQAFYESCKSRLSPGGILVTQNGVPFLQGDELSGTLACLRPLFADAACYLAAVPTYVGGAMAFGWASDDPSPRQSSLPDLRSRFEKARITTRYYSPEVHLASFALPPYIAALTA